MYQMSMENSAKASTISVDQLISNAKDGVPCRSVISSTNFKYVFEDTFAIIDLKLDNTVTSSSSSEEFVKLETLCTSHLVTCAGVVLVGNTKAALYHAGSGVMANRTLCEVIYLLDELNTTRNIRVAYAVPGKLDANYMKSLQVLLHVGIKEPNVVVIEHAGGNFGVNSKGMVGSI